MTPFREALERDRRLGRLPDAGVAEWRYIRRTRHDVDQPLVFEYEGPGDLLHWIADRFERLDDTELSGAVSRSFWRAEPSYIPHRDELLARSASSHERAPEPARCLLRPRPLPPAGRLQRPGLPLLHVDRKRYPNGRRLRSGVRTAVVSLRHGARRCEVRVRGRDRAALHGPAVGLRATRPRPLGLRR